jgi:hypothetical protein
VYALITPETKLRKVLDFVKIKCIAEIKELDEVKKSAKYIKKISNENNVYKSDVEQCKTVIAKLEA